MKLLIAYDGSSCSEAALDDLTRAGLPDDAEALVLTIGEIWLPSPADEPIGEYADHLENDWLLNKNGKNGSRTCSEVKILAKHAHKRLQVHFPNWKVEIQTDCGSPAQEIINQSNRIRADLIVVGSHGRGGRFILGSVSNKVVSEAVCSVRVARGRIEVDPIPSRVVIGYDGSHGANAAVDAVIARKWREGSEFRLITVADQVAPSAIERFVPPIAHWVENEIRAEHEWIKKIIAPALEKLRAAGLAATADICAGNPKQILIEEAARWHSDCIFVGANRFGSRLKKFLLGSVSAAIAARAACSVEVVRKNDVKS